jgi:hypothetical protein
MQHFIHRENLKLLKKQLEATTDEARRWMLLRLLAEEEAKGEQLGEEGEKEADREVLMEQS